MAIDTAMFLEDFESAVDDMPTNAAFDSFNVNGLFQKVSQMEEPLMAGIESNTSATFYVSLDELGSDDINIGDKCTIATNPYRVLAVHPYQHGQFFRLELTDENS